MYFASSAARRYRTSRLLAVDFFANRSNTLTGTPPSDSPRCKSDGLLTGRIVQDWSITLTIDVSALGSVTLSLEELIDRLRDLYRHSNEDDEVGSELREVERQLQMASRRLEKAMRRAVS